MMTTMPVLQQEPARNSEDCLDTCPMTSHESVSQLDGRKLRPRGKLSRRKPKKLLESQQCLTSQKSCRRSPKRLPQREAASSCAAGRRRKQVRQARSFGLSLSGRGGVVEASVAVPLRRGGFLFLRQMCVCVCVCVCTHARVRARVRVSPLLSDPPKAHQSTRQPKDWCRAAGLGLDRVQCCWSP